MTSSSYGGSLVLSPLTEHLRLSVDQLNFIVSQLCGLGLALIWRKCLGVKTVGVTLRHLFGLVFGLAIGYFCYGFQAGHLLGLPVVCYGLMVLVPAHSVHLVVLVVALLYLSALHLQRQLFDFGGQSLDISGPLMVITQKVTTLAFSLKDGSDKSTTKHPRAITKRPTPLEFFSYMLLFPSLMAGPAIFFNDYKNFIEQTQKNGTSQPNPTKIVIKKVLLSLLCALIFVVYLPMFPIQRIKDENFIENTSLSYKFWYLTVCTTLVRFKYYFAWTLADAICNNAGLGYDPNTETWSAISNVDIFKFEFAKSLKESIEAWNLGTNTWLRTLVYERTKKYSTVLTYALSAVWHGFYAGYYLTFASGALFTFASRTVRRHVRGYFTGTFEAKLLYDILTFGVTHLVLAYITFPFILLEFSGSVRLYNKMYWCLHLAALAVWFGLPKVLPVQLGGSNANSIKKNR